MAYTPNPGKVGRDTWNTYLKSKKRKGVLSGLLGIFMASIGMDAITCVTRFSFGMDTLKFGIDMLPAMIALIALTQVVQKLMAEPTTALLLASAAAMPSRLPLPNISGCLEARRLIANLFLYPIGLLLTRAVAKIIQVRYTYLAPVIIMFCFAGAFAATGKMRSMEMTRITVIIKITQEMGRLKKIKPRQPRKDP